MEHEMAMRQMRAHLAHAGREIRSARQFLETPAGRDTNLALGGGGGEGGESGGERPPSLLIPPPPQRHGLHRRRYGHDRA
jgi:hypothetical protein